jgi:hypothetical protein
MSCFRKWPMIWHHPLPLFCRNTWNLLPVICMCRWSTCNVEWPCSTSSKLTGWMKHKGSFSLFKSSGLSRSLSPWASWKRFLETCALKHHKTHQNQHPISDFSRTRSPNLNSFSSENIGAQLAKFTVLRTHWGHHDFVVQLQVTKESKCNQTVWMRLEVNENQFRLVPWTEYYWYRVWQLYWIKLLIPKPNGARPWLFAGMECIHETLAIYLNRRTKQTKSTKWEKRYFHITQQLSFRTAQFISITYIQY